MVRSFSDFFEQIRNMTDEDFDVTCSYLEVYNELIYDLLQPTTSSGPLDLREDPEQGELLSSLLLLRKQRLPLRLLLTFA